MSRVISIFQPKVIIDNKKYTIKQSIGEGAFAFVYEASLLSNEFNTTKSNKFAIKKIICQTDEQLEEANREIHVMKSLVHKNILSLISSEKIHNKKTLYNEVFLVLPLFHTNLQKVIDNGNVKVKDIQMHTFMSHINLSRFHYILKQVICGILAIHQAGFRHGDIKPANILLDENDHVVVTDFGSCSPIEILITSRSQALSFQEDAALHTTASIRAPELFDTPSSCIINGKADVWSLGCVMYTMMYSRTPFESPKEGLSTLAVQAGQYPIPQDPYWSSSFLDIVKGCLTVNIGDRWDVQSLQANIESLDVGKQEETPLNIDISEEEFGEFEGASLSSTPMNSSFSIESLRSVTTNEIDNDIIKTFSVKMQRPTGLMKQRVVKSVCCVITKKVILLRKSLATNSKIYAVMSIISPFKMNICIDSNDSNNENSISPLGPFRMVVEGEMLSNLYDINKDMDRSVSDETEDDSSLNLPKLNELEVNYNIDAPPSPTASSFSTPSKSSFRIANMFKSRQPTNSSQKHIVMNKYRQSIFEIGFNSLHELEDWIAFVKRQQHLLVDPTISIDAS